MLSGLKVASQSTTLLDPHHVNPHLPLARPLLRAYACRDEALRKCAWRNRDLAPEQSKYQGHRAPATPKRWGIVMRTYEVFEVFDVASLEIGLEELNWLQARGQKKRRRKRRRLRDEKATRQPKMSG